MGWQDAPELSPQQSSKDTGWMSAPPVQAAPKPKQKEKDLPGVSSRVRAIVGAVDKPDDKIETLRKFYPKSVVLPHIVEGNFNALVLGGPEGDFVYNPQGFRWDNLPADLASLSREAAQLIGAGLGAAGGFVLGGPVGAMAGASGGAVLGDEALGAAARAGGAVDTRSTLEHIADTAFLAGTEGLGQGVGQLVGAGARGVGKGAFRGGEAGRQEAANAISDLERFGATPSLAQATKSPMLDSLETFVGGTPGGHGRIRKVVESTVARIHESLQARTGGTLISTESAGKTIKGGIKQFVKESQDKATQLYDRLDNFIPSTTQIDPVNTRTTLQDLANIAPQFPEFNDLLTSPSMRGMARALPGQPIPYELLKRMRTKIGNRLNDTRLTSDTPTAELKQLYGALTEDMKAAAQQAGPQAMATFNRANKYWAARMARIEDFLEPINKKAIPEKAFTALERGGREGPTQIRALRKSLTDDQWRVVTNTVVQRLGKQLPGAQTAEDAQFSFQTFLTSWNKLPVESKDALFGGPGLRMLRSDLDALARASSRVAESSKAFYNPPGTGQRLLGQGMMLGGAIFGVGGLVTGSSTILAFAAGVPVLAGGANLMARLMTSPKFVHWLAQSTKIAPNGLAAHLGRLSAVASGSHPEVKEDILEFLRIMDSGLAATETPLVSGDTEIPEGQ